MFGLSSLFRLFSLFVCLCDWLFVCLCDWLVGWLVGRSLTFLFSRQVRVKFEAITMEAHPSQRLSRLEQCCFSYVVKNQHPQRRAARSLGTQAWRHRDVVRSRSGFDWCDGWADRIQKEPAGIRHRLEENVIRYFEVRAVVQ